MRTAVTGVATPDFQLSRTGTQYEREENSLRAVSGLVSQAPAVAFAQAAQTPSTAK
jgi:hypothetical protein